jgi:ABC-2 type transport system ATP-binding protein
MDPARRRRRARGRRDRGGAGRERRGRAWRRRRSRRLGFESLLGDRLRELSNGSLQKVVVAQAFLGSPALIVLDEPFPGLDSDAQRALGRLIDERAAEGAAVVLSDLGGRDDVAGPPIVSRSWHVAEGRVT